MNSQLATIGAGLINLIMAAVSIPVMARVNRRTTLQISLSLTAFFLIILGTAITFIVNQKLYFIRSDLQKFLFSLRFRGCLI